MRNLIVLTFLFLLLSIPGALGTTVCDDELCLEYAGTITAGSSIRYFDTDGSDYIIGMTGNHIIRLNSTWDLIDDVDTVTLYSHANAFGHGWDRITGYYLSSFTAAGNNYFGKYNFTPAELDYANKGRLYEAGGDYYDGYFWVHDDAGAVYKLDYAQNELDSFSCVPHEGGVHHLNTTNRILVCEATGTGAITMYDLTGADYGTIDLSSFGLSVPDFCGLTAWDDDAVLYVSTGTSTVYYFNLNATATESTLTPIQPTPGESYGENIILMELDLVAGLNGTLNCYVNDTLTFNGTYENGTHNSISFSSGTLDPGAHTWYCNFTDSASNVWDFDPAGFTILSGLMNTLGDAIADFMGFDSDGLGSALTKGKSFLAMILSLSVAFGVGGHFKSGELFGVAFIGMILLFSFTGDLPVWIGLVLIIISGFLVSKLMGYGYGAK